MVTRNIHPDTMAAISAGGFAPVVLVYLDWPDGLVRMHSNVGTISFGGNDWTGVGPFLNVQAPEEAQGLAQSVASVQLVGAPDELDAYLDAPIRGRMSEIWFGVVTERAGSTLIGQPFRIYAGYMDGLVEGGRSENGDFVRIVTVEVANGPSQRLSASLYHTDEDQRRQHPADTAGRLVINTERRYERLTWPE